MGRFITTKADFTLRRKHKKGSGATIYENDYATINPMPNALKGDYVIGDSNFVFTSRLGINGQKKHVRGKFIPNPMGEESAWTIDTIIDSGITDETKIRLKPNYTSIRDFACYGSAVKLVQGTINGVINDFPAEMWFSDEPIKIYNAAPDKAGYSFNEENGEYKTGYLLYNEYEIDITTQSVLGEKVYNPMRYLALCGSSYTYIDKNGESHEFVGFSVTGCSMGSCYNGKSVEVDKLADVDITFEGGNTIRVEVYKDNDYDTIYYVYDGGLDGARIRPKKKIIEDYFRDCDDFTAVLLERSTKPIYTSVFKTPQENETGFSYEMVSYVWPTLNGGFNPDLSGAYFAYVQSLIDLGEFYDEYHTDNMWRSLTHEAIKTLDWTYVTNSDGEIQDMSTIDTSRIEPITKIYGRQFDDLKRYADGIKTINTITYDQKSNAPDYVLTDILENSGWETEVPRITTDKDIITESLYSGLTSGYSSSDASTEFLRRLKLNSDYLFSVKGTRKGLDTMLALFGFTPEEYDIHEYVCVFSAATDQFPHFCNSTKDKHFSYPLAKDVETINKYKINFDAFDPYGDYCGIPVTEVGYVKDGENYSYVVPWFSQGKKYDDGLYFQMSGGWGKRKSMNVDLEIAPNIKKINEIEGFLSLYAETQARLRFAKDFDELLQEAYAEAKQYDVFYVTDISGIETEYKKGTGEDLTKASHYFVLENGELNQFLGYCSDGDITGYGWRSITTDEIQDPGNQYGTLVLYLESIKDNTNGNNPHIGGGTYDGGESYIDSMSDIFGYSLVNKNFIGIDDNTCNKIKEYVFDVEKQEDNRKCWFFSDDYNRKYGKKVTCRTPSTNDECCTVDDTKSEVIEFLEVDMSDKICNERSCNDSTQAGPNCNGGLAYDVVDMLKDEGGENAAPKVGDKADNYFGPVITEENAEPTYYDEVYGRKSALNAFDPEEEKSGESGEAAANSIVNLKNIRINFKPQYWTNDNISPDLVAEIDEGFREYIERTVMPYLTQMIPSTSILEVTFCE